MTETQNSVEVGGDVAEVSVTLRLFADDLDPDHVTDQLGANPTHAHRRGDRVSAKSEARRTQGTWQLRSSLPGDRPIEEHIGCILQMLPAELDIWKQATQAFRKDVYCWIIITSQVSGLSLESSTLEQLATRGLRLEFDFFVRNEPDDDT